jgi:hypothetical protein
MYVPPEVHKKKPIQQCQVEREALRKLPIYCLPLHGRCGIEMIFGAPIGWR